MWISVSDRLPAQKSRVLCAVGKPGKQRLHMLDAMHPEPGVNDDDEFGWFDGEDDFAGPVTHWWDGHLPALPGTSAPQAAQAQPQESTEEADRRREKERLMGGIL